MTGKLEIQPQTPVIYPSEDGEPLAESYDHLYGIFVTLEVLRQYLIGRQATVLGDQFLYYCQGNPRMRVTPDVMVICELPNGESLDYTVGFLPNRLRDSRFLTSSTVSTYTWAIGELPRSRG